MDDTLNISLRPRRLSEVYGQGETIKAVRYQAQKRPPLAWLFHGPSGTGKTTLAKIVAASFNCSHMKEWGEPCDACYDAEENQHNINASDATGVEELRQVLEVSRCKTTTGKRVIILDEFHKASNSAQNLLLTPLESKTPSRHVVWIICSSEAPKIIIALRRRCAKYALKTLSYAGVEEYLKEVAAKAQITRPLPPLLEQLNAQHVSAPGFIVQAAEKYAAGVSAFEAVTDIDAGKVDPFKVAQAVAAGGWKEVRGQLSDATTESVRAIRNVVAAYLKTILSKSTDSKKSERCALGLIDLATMPFDESASVMWLWGTLYKVTKRFREAE